MRISVYTLHTDMYITMHPIYLYTQYILLQTVQLQFSKAIIDGWYSERNSGIRIFASSALLG